MLLRLIFILSLFSQTSFCFSLDRDTTIVRLNKITNLKKRCFEANNAALMSWYNGDYKRTIRITNMAIPLAIDQKLDSVLALLYNHRGIANDYLGNFSLALDDYFKALKIAQNIKNRRIEAGIYSDIGLIYSNQNLTKKALYYQEKALKIRIEDKDTFGISVSLNNIAIVYNLQKEYQKAIDYYKRCIEIDEKIGILHSLSTSYGNISLAFSGLEKYDEARFYLQKSLEINNSVGNPLDISTTLLNIGILDFKLGDFQLARESLLKSVELSKKLNHKEQLRFGYEMLYKLEDTTGRPKEALDYLLLHFLYRDSINNVEDTRKQTELEMEFQFSKEREIEKLKQVREKDKFYFTIWSICGVLFVILIFSFILYRKWRESASQRLIIEEKNKEVRDSINYAKRIQTAILPSNELLNELLPKHFLIYQPKDIVSGDFYWLHQNNEKTFVAVADCTGHGVPGAMMSVICHNALARVVRENPTFSTNQILENTRDIIVSELSKSHENVKDGMDISICQLDLENKECFWSGANNPLWIIRNSADQIEEIKGAKQSISVYNEYLEMKSHSLKFELGDRLYLFSDGYVDQFGGEQGKKLMAKRMKEYLIYSTPMEIKEQGVYLQSQFNLWKGKVDQIDDVCLLGIEI